MAKRYRKTFTICDTEQQAMALCVKCNANDYLRKHHPANYTPFYLSKDERKFVVWHYTK